MTEARDDPRYRFWEAFLERARLAGSPHATIPPSTEPFIERRQGQYTWIYRAHEHDASIELYVNGFSNRGNVVFFAELQKHRDEVELEYGGPLMWDQAEGRKYLKVWTPISGGGYGDVKAWPQLHDSMVNSMTRLISSLRPHLATASLTAQGFEVLGR